MCDLRVVAMLVSMAGITVIICLALFMEGML